jgi:hypothetical protein
MLDPHMTQLFASSSKQVMRVFQIHAVVEDQRGMAAEDCDAADAISENSF